MSTVPLSASEAAKLEKDLREAELPADINLPDNYVDYTLKNTKPLPPVTWNNWWKELNYLSLAILTITPAISLYGSLTTKLRLETAVFAVIYYFITGWGITAGYHRLWAHRSYNASKPLQYFLAVAGAGAVEGSIKWWSRGHRAHHRYTDTELDPYNAHRGLLWSHIGWMVVKPRRKPGVADVSDLSKTRLSGGSIVAARLLFVHHSTFCVNSLAHWLGDAPFDDKHTPRDHAITAVVTLGEGYHNFHHQFPSDFRNAIRWYQYDPTKWFITVCSWLGLASHLKTFPDNEVKKGQLTMQLQRLRETQEGIVWPQDNDLPVISWQSFQEQCQKRPLILIAGFIHDVSAFIDEHPGGRHLLVKNIGKDASTAFFGGVYDHSNAAHNRFSVPDNSLKLLSMMRVGILQGGAPHGLDDKAVPPSQRLRVARHNELSSPYSSAALSDGEGMLG
ncbi:delta 9-fatty acid desaturase [Lactarius quietus]|nr:delta 9-fatty acid desaturase [Lactarius quietus]